MLQADQPTPSIKTKFTASLWRRASGKYQQWRWTGKAKGTWEGFNVWIRGEENDVGEKRLSRSGETIYHMNEGERRLEEASSKYKTPQSHLKTCKICLNITRKRTHTIIFYVIVGCPLFFTFYSFLVLLIRKYACLHARCHNGATYISVGTSTTKPGHF